MKTVTSRSLSHLPISVFSVVLGLSGTAIAAEKITPLLGLPVWVSVFFSALAAVIFMILATLYGYKILRYPQAVRAEFFHPIKLTFFPTITISLLLLSITSYVYTLELSRILWIGGSVGQLAITLVVISIWIQHTHFDMKHMNPAWFIPAVGNIIVPVVGVFHAPLAISWFFFSVGFIFWLNLMAIFFNRIIFHHPLPEKLLPTLCILIAPPAIGFISLVKLQGVVTDAAMMLYYIATFFFLLMIAQLNLFTKIKFYLSWWAYSFPIAAFTIATTLLAHTYEQGLLLVAARSLFMLLVAIIILLVVKTLQAVYRREICILED